LAGSTGLEPAASVVTPAQQALIRPYQRPRGGQSPQNARSGPRLWKRRKTSRQKSFAALSDTKVSGRWATAAKNHLLKYRPKMAAQLQAQGRLDDWALKMADRAVEEAGLSIENEMQPLEAESEAKKNHMFLPSEEDQPELGADSNIV
jgi:hypothetical protein